MMRNSSAATELIRGIYVSLVYYVADRWKEGANALARLLLEAGAGDKKTKSYHK